MVFADSIPGQDKSPKRKEFYSKVIRLHFGGIVRQALKWITISRPNGTALDCGLKIRVRIPANCHEFVC